MKNNKKSPLTDKPLRNPGQSLDEQINDLLLGYGVNYPDTWGSLIAREVRILARISAIIEQGRQKQNIQAAMQGFYIYPKLKNLIIQTLDSRQVEDWQQILKQLLQADNMAKGAELGNPWEMTQLILAHIANNQFLDNRISV